MRKLLCHYLIFVASIFLAAKVLPGVSYGNDLVILAKASLLLSLVHVVVRPIVNLVALPINILTLGLFSFFVNGLMLYLVTLLIPVFKVTSFHFPYVNLGILRISSFYVSSFMSFIIVALLISTIRNFFIWLCSK